MKFLAENNIDINSLDNIGNNILICQLKNKVYSNHNKTFILKLIGNFNFDIHKQDEELRTFLHYLILSLKSSSDVDVSLLQKILSLGADCNIKDIYQRTPLHYLFLENSNETYNAYIDPIVYLSTLLEIKDIDTDIPDYLGNIPLHYAAQRGSTISAMSLFNKDFINYKNKEGNTPLAYALIFDQVNIATYLFQQNSNINDNVYPLKERNIYKYLKEKELEAKKLSRRKRKI
jgi:ankyrin repeat protein